MITGSQRCWRRQPGLQHTASGQPAAGWLAWQLLQQADALSAPSEGSVNLSLVNTLAAQGSVDG